MGGLTEQIGNKPEALALHRKALALRRELAAEPDADPGAKLDLARSLIAIGLLIQSNMEGLVGAIRGAKTLVTIPVPFRRSKRLATWRRCRPVAPIRAGWREKSSAKAI